LVGHPQGWIIIAACRTVFSVCSSRHNRVADDDRTKTRAGDSLPEGRYGAE
jgi:hypothetical protein